MKVKVNAIEGLPCLACGLGTLPLGTVLAWLAVAGLVGTIFIGTLGMKRTQGARG